MSLLCLACSDRPEPQPIEGDPFVHAEAGFRIILPDGWQTTRSHRALTLVRELPYGGGYPTLAIRSLADDEKAPMQLEGQHFSNEQGRIEYRYRRWHNPRGAGHRLEVLIRGDQLNLFIEASVWDPAKKLNRSFFERSFWPIINSIRAH